MQKKYVLISFIRKEFIFRLLLKKNRKKSEFHIKIPKQLVSLSFDGSIYSIIWPFKEWKKKEKVSFPLINYL